jgi:uncharacterized membrane protein YgcG
MRMEYIMLDEINTLEMDCIIGGQTNCRSAIRNGAEAGVATIEIGAGAVSVVAGPDPATKILGGAAVYDGAMRMNSVRESVNSCSKDRAQRWLNAGSASSGGSSSGGGGGSGGGFGGGR